MKKITLFAAISFCILFTKLYAQVGIGTATPNAPTGASVSRRRCSSPWFVSPRTIPLLSQVFRRITCDIQYKPVCDREQKASYIYNN